MTAMGLVQDPDGHLLRCWQSFGRRHAAKSGH